MRLRPLTLVLLALLAFGLGAAPAAMATSITDKIIADCTDDGVLQGHYTQHQLQRALASLPSDVNEYTNCSDVISAAIGRAAGGPGGFGSGAAPGTNPLSGASAAERADLARAARTGGGPISLGPGLGVIRPGDLRPTAATVSTVPKPLLIAAILLVVGALAAAAPWLKRHVLARLQK